MNSSPSVFIGQTQAQPDSQALLGNNAISSSTLPNLYDGARFHRYYLQSIIRSVLASEGTRSGLDHPLNFHKVCKCRFLRFSNDPIGVNQTLAHGKCHFSGLVICGSVWACPVCAALIQERRTLEVRRFFDHAYSVQGQKVIMITLTFSHTREDSLASLLSKQSHAFKLLRAGRAHSDFKAKFGMYSGFIRGLEIVYGVNGWHPHTHELYIVPSDVNVEELKADLLIRYRKICLKLGLITEEKLAFFDEHSIHVFDNCHATDYLLKQGKETWGADREVAKSSSKTGKKSGKTPFQLLDSTYKEQQLFLEYIKATKSKRQLYWSKGLKKLVGLDDISDEEIALQKIEKSLFICSLSVEQWRKIRANDLRAEILTAAENGGRSSIVELLKLIA